MSAASAAAAAALAAVLASPGGARAEPCPLGLAADPAWLDLGEGGTAELRVRGAAAPPLLSASAGRIEDVRQDGDAYVATYVPPPDPWPQLAIVVAFDGERHGALSIPLHGHGVARVEARPGTEVSVTIGARTFGPVRTGPDGRATVPVAVAPGVTEARRGRQVIPLRPPPLRRVHLAASARATRGDREEELLLVAAVVTEDGSPARGALPEVEAAEGVLSPAGSCGPGVFAWRWRLAPGPVRSATATARLGDVPPAGLSLPVLPGPAARIALEPGALAAAAGGGVEVVVRAEDAAGNPVLAPPAVAAAPGAVTALEPSGPGEWRARYVAPERLGAARAAALRASLDGTAAEAALALEAAEPAVVHVTAPAVRLPADGRSALLLRIDAADAFGNAVGPPEVGAGAGLLSAPRADGAGWTVEYTPPWLERGGEDRVVARVGGVSGDARLALAPPVRRLGLALRAGAAVRRGSGPAPDAGLEVSAWPDRLGGRIGLAVEGGGSSLSRTATLVDGATSARLTGEATLVTAGVSLAGALRRGDVSLRLGAGPGVAFAATRLSQGGTSRGAGSALVPEAHAALALGLATARGTPFAVLRLSWIGDLEGTAFTGPLRTASLGLGWRLDAL